MLLHSSWVHFYHVVWFGWKSYSFDFVHSNFEYTFCISVYHLWVLRYVLRANCKLSSKNEPNLPSTMDLSNPLLVLQNGQTKWMSIHLDLTYYYNVMHTYCDTNSTTLILAVATTASAEDYIYIRHCERIENVKFLWWSSFLHILYLAT